MNLINSMSIKMKKLVYLILLLIVVSNLTAMGQSADKKQSLVIAKGAVVQKAGEGYSFTEGPAVDPEGNVFFTDQPNDKILKWSPDGTVSVYMEGAGRSNGLYFDNNGNLLSCADLNNELWLIDKSKKVTVLVKDFEGKKLNGPNDLWVDAKGGVYFTDPFYKREYWSRTEKEIEKENVLLFVSGQKKSDCSCI
jgi:gluconolactonase